MFRASSTLTTLKLTAFPTISILHLLSMHYLLIKVSLVPALPASHLVYEMVSCVAISYMYVTKQHSRVKAGSIAQLRAFVHLVWRNADCFTLNFIITILNRGKSVKTMILLFNFIKITIRGWALSTQHNHLKNIGNVCMSDMRSMIRVCMCLQQWHVSCAMAYTAKGE